MTEDKVELLDGLRVAMSPQGDAHGHVTQKLAGLLASAVGRRASVQVQSPLAIDDLSQPEPDIAIVPAGGDPGVHPTTALLVVEVAETSLEKDRFLKKTLYARAGVREYWIVNLPERVVQVFRAPWAGAYTEFGNLWAAGTLRPQAFADVQIPVAEILP